MATPLEDLLALLDVERIEVNIFRGTQPNEERQRVFGGQVAGQALIAASRTVDEPARMVHSLHAYFLRPGDPAIPILYEVDQLRNGRSFTTRRVVAVQHGRPIFNLQASFHESEPGLEFGLPPIDGLPDPETLPTMQQRLEPFKDQLGEAYFKPRPLDVRVLGPDLASTTPSAGQTVFLRTNGTLPDDPIIHACIATYASDMTLLDTALRPFGLSGFTANIMMASLDHAMWFHRPFRADDWLVYQQRALSASSARGLAGGSIFTPDGQLAVNVVQEGLIRKVDERD